MPTCNPGAAIGTRGATHLLISPRCWTTFIPPKLLWNSISRGQFFREFLFGVTLKSCKIFHRQENGAGIKLIGDTRQFGLLYLMFGRVCRSWSLALARRGAKVGASVWRRAWSAAHFVIVKEIAWKMSRLTGNLTKSMYTFYVKCPFVLIKCFQAINLSVTMHKGSLQNKKTVKFGNCSQ